MKTISLLGSTGSIGTQTLDIVRNHPDRFRVCALSAGKNEELMERQIREFHPEIAVLYEEEAARSLRERVGDTSCRILSGMDGLIEAATMPGADLVLGAIVGMIGIRPVIAAVTEGKDVALANKETLVCAGHLIMPLAKEMKVQILPVDSEHSAIFQSLRGGAKGEAEEILLTASGGPFRGKKKEELESMRAGDALKHPNWDMGPKVTIDSASLVNKGLEVMEASWLFNMPPEKIRILVHPQSIIHSMVQFRDGAIIAQLGTPDMHLPIQYALSYPERIPLEGKRVDFFELGKLTFEKPDIDTFRGLALALEAAKKGGSLPTVFNAANEEAVRLFLEDRISFLGIPRVIEEAMDRIAFTENPSVDDIMEIEAETRKIVKWELS
ncbi:MAG: 1-deoxy-D-xylulose-5-phosphate reductoisomerase [Lachnospiraceae bacterium]|nr:1-deoxy-D-xylulose-5-phosphate reductoisomerase [Lachnospiraceae bacterium]